MLRRRSGKSPVDAPIGDWRPRSLIGATLLALVSPDKVGREQLNARFEQRFPNGAADQEVVGEFVFTELACRLFESVHPDDAVIEQFGTALVELMGGSTPIPPQAMVGEIRAALTGGRHVSGLDATQLMRVHTGFSHAALRQLELAPDVVGRLVVEAELHAAEAGVWLVPAEEQAGEALLEPGRDSRRGPWDVAELEDPRAGRADFGSLLLRVPQGIDLQLVAQDDDEIVAVEMHAAHTVLQLNVFAAPSGSRWNGVRGELAAQIVRSSGTARELVGIGVELWTQTVDRDGAPGAEGIRHMRFLGADGPGWMLRGVLIWHGRSVESEAAELESVFRDAAVALGDADLADGARLPLHVPR